MSGTRLAWLEPALLDGAARLRAQVWGGSPEANSAYLDWKYLRNPYLAEPLLLLALCDGAVVGMRGLFGTCWSRGPEAARHVLPAAAETIVDPARRDSGLFGELNERCLDEALARGHRHLLNLSATPENALTSIVTLGWRSAAAYDVLALTSGGPEQDAGIRRSLVRRLRRSSGRSPFSALDRARALPGGVRAAGASAPAEVAALAAGRPHGGRLHHVCDPAFLAWRLASPIGSYRVLMLGDPPEAYVVLGRPSWSDRVEVLDWDGVSAEAQLRLLGAVLEHGRLRHVRLWGAPLDPDTREGVERLGFVPLTAATRAERLARTLLVRAAPGAGGEDADRWLLAGERLDDPAAWDVRAIAADKV